VWLVASRFGRCLGFFYVKAGKGCMRNLSKYEEWQIYWNFGRYNEKMDDKKFFWTIKMKNGR
jgi:hypothetical protein